MAQTATVRIRENGDRAYPVKLAVVGGNVLEAVIDSGVDKVQPCSAGSTTVVGVALGDGSPDDTSTGTAINANPLPTAVTAAHGEFYVTYAAQCNVGKAIKAAANGQVTPWVSGTDAADLKIGKCKATTAAGAIGPAYIGH